MITKSTFWQKIQEEMKAIAREKKLTEQVMKKIKELKNENQ